MTAKELIEELQKYPEDMRVYILHPEVIEPEFVSVDGVIISNNNGENILEII